MNKQEKLLTVARDLRIAQTQLNNHSRIANSPLPKHKQPLHDKLVTQCIVKVRNLRSQFNALYGKSAY